MISLADGDVVLVATPVGAVAGELMCWRVERRATGGDADAPQPRLIGFVQFSPATSEIGFGILAPWRGRGHAGRALRLLLREIEASGGAELLTARTRADNVAAIRVLREAGFRPRQAGSSALSSWRSFERPDGSRASATWA